MRFNVGSVTSACVTAAAGSAWALARAYDAVPFAPHRVAAAVLARQQYVARRRAETHPHWVTLQSARLRSGPARAGDVVADGQAWAAQQRLAEQLSPQGVWASSARLVAQLGAVPLLTAAVGEVQRWCADWAGTDDGGAGETVCLVVAAQLEAAARQGQPGPDGTDPALWREQLVCAAAQLRGWVDRSEHPASRALAVARDGGSCAVVAAACEAESAAHAHLLAEARQALVWVAGHLEDLHA